MQYHLNKFAFRLNIIGIYLYRIYDNKSYHNNENAADVIFIEQYLRDKNSKVF